MIIWIGMAIFFAVIEALTVQLVTVWFAVGAVGAIIASALGAEPFTQIVIFVALSLASLVISRPFVKRFTKTKTQPTNADRLIGETALVTESIDNVRGKGAACVKGLEWTARTEDDSLIGEDETVTVVKIEGAKLIVRKKEESED